jgi:hypothetical protein
VTGTATATTRGGSPAPSVSPQPGADRAAFIRDADAACATATQQLNAVPAPSGPSELVRFLRAQLSVQQDLLAQLQRLSPPTGDRAQIEAAFLQPYRQAIARQQQLLPGVAQAVAAGDHVQLANLHTEFDTASHPRSLAAFVHGYGFHACQTFDYFRTP